MKEWDRHYYDSLFNQFKNYWADRNGYRMAFPIKQKPNLYDEVNLKTFNEVMAAIEQLCGLSSYATPNIPLKSICAKSTETKEKIIEEYIIGLYNGQRIGKLLQKGSQYIKATVQAATKNTLPDFDKYMVEGLTDFANYLEEVIQVFNQDPMRKSNFKLKSVSVIISRHPYDMGGCPQDEDGHPALT